MSVITMPTVAAVARLPVAEQHQLVLDGFPEPEGLFFNLTSAKNLPTDKELRWEQHVSGTFSGTMSRVSLEIRGGSLVKVYSITVVEAELR